LPSSPTIPAVVVAVVVDDGVVLAVALAVPFGDAVVVLDADEFDAVVVFAALVVVVVFAAVVVVFATVVVVTVVVTEWTA
jgi:hypothetical protein